MMLVENPPRVLPGVGTCQVAANGQAILCRKGGSRVCSVLMESPAPTAAILEGEVPSTPACGCPTDRTSGPWPVLAGDRRHVSHPQPKPPPLAAPDVAAGRLTHLPGTEASAHPRQTPRAACCLAAVLCTQSTAVIKVP